LVRCIKTACREKIQDAWEQPVEQSSAARMNLGDLGVSSIDSELGAVADSMRKELAWWRLWSI
jgi:hypothetical protein